MREQILKTIDKNSKIEEADLAKMLGMKQEIGCLTLKTRHTQENNGKNIIRNIHIGKGL